MTFHKKNLVPIHHWRGRNIVESEEEKIIIERWQQLIFNHDEAKKEALNYELQMSSIRKYQKREIETMPHLQPPIQEYALAQPGK